MRDLPGNINIYILHSSKDGDLKDELRNHLSFLERLGYIDVWYEGLIQAGDNKKERISEYLQKSHIILLLISANFFADDCYGRYSSEIQLAYERQRRGDVKIIPVILKACDWQLDVLASLNPLPRDGHPVADTEHWDSPDKAFKEIAMELRKISDKLKKTWEKVSLRVDESAKKITKKSNISKTEAKVQSQTSNVPEDSLERCLNNGLIHDEIAESLLNKLFEILVSLNFDTAINQFQELAHPSLFKSTQLDKSFIKNQFIASYERAKIYQFPVKVLASKRSGRNFIRFNGVKEEGIEKIFTIEKIQSVGTFPGQVRLFFPSSGGEPKISKLSL